ncbi:alpha/beta fold hydrolase [Microbacterium sp. BK668]|uniref:alpha/beta fold hydrolase n=1 Tax=Microbacterium sp. BK668 TaxID=2512118 RepID=UPI00105E400E|nr:alpha/beta fold hydrolase [Microbacterium sp. BK668]TDN92910.1 alpha/beta hydrolase family protein [Microbacterium sp. BK668]
MSSVAITRRRHVDEPHFFRTEDGVALTLIHVRGPSEPTKGPVLLVHGAGMRAESFRPPAIRSLVDVLLEDGRDVWMLNWRGSTDLPRMPWTLDDVAFYDHPAAVRHIVDATGAGSIQAIAHCQGSTSLSMAIVAGLVPEVDAVVSNSVSLHPVVPGFSKVKLGLLRPLFQGREPYVDVAWGDGPERGIRRATRNAVRLWHVECREPACNMASFALGSGHPALWHHRNLDPATHKWLSGEFGQIPMSLYTQIAKSQRAHQVVAIQPREGLPLRYASEPPRSTARFALFTGSDNRAFLPQSQKATYAYLDRHQPGRHSLRVIRGYGHADVFVGHRAHVEVFPQFLAALGGGPG